MINCSIYQMKPTFGNDERPKAYARNQVNEVWDADRFAKFVAEHNGIYSRGMIKGVLSDVATCLRQLLLEGHKVQLSDLGTFGITLRCEGADSAESFTAKNILDLKINFAPGEVFEGMRNEAKIRFVDSRDMQEAKRKWVAREFTPLCSR